MASILGLSAFYHDSAAAQEERFTRIKHDPGFPKHAVNSYHQTGDRFDRHLGNLAFPLYLSHDLVDVVFEQGLMGKGPAFKAAMLPVEWLLMAALAGAMYLWVDCPLEKLRQGFVARRRSPVVPAG